MQAVRETVVDYEETARLATDAFASPNVHISPERMQWFYERSFSQGSTVVALREGDRKVGQIAILRQTLRVDGKEESAAQLVDIFVSEGFRGKERLRQLYTEAERQFVEQDIRFAIGMPNAKALGVNQHFFNLRPFLTLPLSMGVCLPRRSPQDLVSFRLDQTTRDRALSLFASFTGMSEENGLVWDAARLVERLDGVERQYGLHVLDDLLLISSPRMSRGISYTLLCGFLTRPGARVAPQSVRGVVRDACRLWRRPLFAYAGVNNKLPALPGIVLPSSIRPSPLLLQLRDFKPHRKPLRLDRFQLLDFDFA